MITRSKADIYKPKAYNVVLLDDIEPSSHKDALANPHWKMAMESKLGALHNRTWQLCTPPPGKRILGCKWVFRIKRNADGTISRYKA